MPKPEDLIVVDGIRYRPDDPKLKQLRETDVADKAVRAPRGAKRPTSKRAARGDVADES